MKHLLIVIGGIAKNAYALNDLKSTKLYEVLDAKYDGGIHQYDYEGMLDGRYRWIPRFVYDHINILDKHGDWFQFATNRKKREEIRYQLLEFIERIKSEHNDDDIKVDFICHSLGTWVLMGAHVDAHEVWLYGSPYSFAGWLGRKICQDDIIAKIRANRALECDTLHYITNQGDLVSSHRPIEMKWLGHMSNQNASVELRGVGHNFQTYLTDCKIENDMRQ